MDLEGFLQDFMGIFGIVDYGMGVADRILFDVFSSSQEMLQFEGSRLRLTVSARQSKAARLNVPIHLDLSFRHGVRCPSR